MTENTLRDWPSFNAAFTLPMRYLLRGSGPGTVVLLHGYQDHALSMTRRMGWLEKDLPFKILAVNAPFPVPVWKSDGFIEAYSWYFRDTSKNLMIVSPATTAEKIATLMSEVLPANEPVVLFGFSQGGYLAPFVAPLLGNVKSIVAVGSGFPDDPYSRVSKSVRVFGIHGSEDRRWPLDASKEAHRLLMDKGFQGEFHVVPDLEHKVDPSLDPLIQRIALTSFGGRP